MRSVQLKRLQAGSGLDQFVGYQLKRAYMRLHPLTRDALARHDLRVVPFSCLSMIVDRPGIVQADLAAELSIERSNLVAVIDELEQRGLITRSRMKEDRRRYALQATPEGVGLQLRASADIAAGEDAMLGGLTDEQRQALAELLRLVARSAAEPTDTTKGPQT